MVGLKPRRRLVNFRLTEDEYRSLATVCLQKGAPSISDFARSAILRSMELQIHPEGPLQSQLSNLNQRVAQLETSFRDLTQLLDRLARRPSRRPHQAPDPVSIPQS